MNTQADTYDKYFAAAGEREPDLRQLDAWIKESAPDLKPVLFIGMSGTGLGYGMMPYKTKSMKVQTEWPIIGLMNQKHYMSLYICAVDPDGQYIAEKNADRLGKVNCGRSCIRFKKIEDLNLDVVREILADISNRLAAGEKLFGI